MRCRHRRAVRRSWRSCKPSVRLPVVVGLVRSHVSALLSTLLRQGYSREQELDADAFGAKTARPAGKFRAAADLWDEAQSFVVAEFARR